MSNTTENLEWLVGSRVVLSRRRLGYVHRRLGFPPLWVRLGYTGSIHRKFFCTSFCYGSCFRFVGGVDFDIASVGTVLKWERAMLDSWSWKDDPCLGMFGPFVGGWSGPFGPGFDGHRVIEGCDGDRYGYLGFLYLMPHDWAMFSGLPASGVMGSYSQWSFGEHSVNMPNEAVLLNDVFERCHVVWV